MVRLVIESSGRHVCLLSVHFRTRGSLSWKGHLIRLCSNRAYLTEFHLSPVLTLSSGSWLKALRALSLIGAQLMLSQYHSIASWVLVECLLDKLHSLPTPMKFNFISLGIASRETYHLCCSCSLNRFSLTIDWHFYIYCISSIFTVDLCSCHDTCFLSLDMTTLQGAIQSGNVGLVCTLLRESTDPNHAAREIPNSQVS